MSTPSPAALIWFRRDLRVGDHPALTAALESHERVIAVFVLDEPSLRPIGGASRWWVHGALDSLATDLAELGIPLELRTGDPVAALHTLAAEQNANRVYATARPGAAEAELDARVHTELGSHGIEVHYAAPDLLVDPGLRTGEGRPYTVFTPFWKRALDELARRPPRAVLPVPQPARTPTAVNSAAFAAALDHLELRPTSPNWAENWDTYWSPGEAGAHERLADFLDEDLGDYPDLRDRPDRSVTSRLSPHLVWGEITVSTIWHAVDEHRRTHPGQGASFLSELGWREFAHYQLFHFPKLATDPWRPSFANFPWPEADPELLRAWQTGTTGIDLVDAGMNELWQTGTMHNRVRMVVASLLTKNLLQHWRAGEEWFWDTLVDADPAANPFNWQWVAGSGADAAPYFRIFNPELQAKKFDPNREYIRRWVPDTGLRTAPIVDLKASREAALEAYRKRDNPV